MHCDGTLDNLAKRINHVDGIFWAQKLLEINFNQTKPFVNNDGLYFKPRINGATKSQNILSEKITGPCPEIEEILGY